MKNFISSIFIAFLIIFCSGFFMVANAQTSNGFIVLYDTTIEVNTDNSIAVTEKIIFDTDSAELHGIYRDIHPYSSQNRKMDISDIKVVDENNHPHFFQILSSDSNVRIKIGDPFSTFNGRKTYYIQYVASDAVAQFEDLDKLHWNIIGNEWKLPIREAKATVILPTIAKPLQVQCFYGSEGSTNRCINDNQLSTTTFFFKTAQSLSPHEGFTVELNFAKGIVLPYPAHKTSMIDLVIDFCKKYLFWPTVLTLPILSLIISLFYWHRRGRDSRKTNTIVTQYDVIDDLTPLEVTTIINENIAGSDISAEIIYLATKGYIKIKQLETEHVSFRLSEGTDFEITLLKDYSDLPNEFDRLLLQGLFKNKSDELKTVKLSELQLEFYKDASLIMSLTLESVLKKGYYKNLGRMRHRGLIIHFLNTIVLFLVLALIVNDSAYLPILIISIFISGSISATVYYFSPAKTEKGVAAKEHFLGLKSYLQIAEKDRLAFHNSPESKPERFEKLLPYAMVLNASRIWLKELERIHTTPPSWYSHSSGANLNVLTFGQFISQFQSVSTSYLTSTPSSGSGGFGGSGGGGGRGGGGSW